MILRAAYVLDMKFQVAADWAVRIAGERIAEVGPAHRLGGDTVVDLGDVLLMPGLVNAHTHLELGFLSSKVSPRNGFAGWLADLLTHLREVPDDAPQVGAGIQSGSEAALHSGTTLIGDIARSPTETRAAIAALTRRPAVRSFGEVIAIGALRNRLDAQLADATDAPTGVENLTIGVSPHAPYTVEPDALTACVARARAADLPLCIHAAESEEELLFCREGRGPLRDFLESAGVWDDRVPVAGCSPIELLDRCGALGPQTLLAHCNYLSDSEIELLAKSRTHVVYCPRTHAAFGHPPHPIAQLQARRVNVCIGTDSLASNPSLSMLEELQFLRHARPDIKPQTLLDMATLSGAAALGHLDNPARGVLANGTRADLIALAVPHGTPKKQVAEEALANVRLTFVMIGGKVVRSIGK